MTYYLILLRKVSSNWSISGGYTWSDAGSSTTNALPDITTPSGDNWSKHISHKTLHTVQKETKEWSGLWEFDSNPESKEVLEKIKVRIGDSSGIKAWEILGREPTQDGGQEIDFNKCTSLSQCGYDSSNRFYKKDKGWVAFQIESKSWKNITQTLNEYYSPFKNKKGIWKDIDSHCKYLSRTRNMEKSELDKLSDFCYSK